MSWFDAASAPGWHDFLGLGLTVIGFAVALVQIAETRRETARARIALENAQRHLSQRALMGLVPQLQGVAHDLDYAMPAGDVQVAKRALVRFGLLAREAEALLTQVEGDHGSLQTSLKRTAAQASRAKASILGSAAPDLVTALKATAKSVDDINQEVTLLTSTMKNTVEGQA